MKTITLTLFSTTIAITQFLQVNGFSSDITDHIFNKFLKILGTSSSSSQEKEQIIPQIITAVNPQLMKIYQLQNPIIEEIITEEIPNDFSTTNSSATNNYTQIQQTMDIGNVFKLETTENTPALENSTEYRYVDTTIPYKEYGIPYFSDPVEFRSINQNEQQNT